MKILLHLQLLQTYCMEASLLLQDVLLFSSSSMHFLCLHRQGGQGQQLQRKRPHEGQLLLFCNAKQVLTIFVIVSPCLAAAAGKALKDNITTLGPRVLPMSEMLVFGANMIARKLLKMRVAPYIPDFQVAAQHICIHTGGCFVCCNMS
jgi:hypothetical protein